MENDGRSSEINLYELQKEQLQKVTSIRGDKEKRAVYDQTGSVDDAELSGDLVDNLRDFFKAMYKMDTKEDIEEFEANYKGFESEKKYLIELYKKFKGKMDRLFCSMLCSDPKLDSHRFKDIIDEAIAAGFKDIIDEAIAAGEVKPTKAYKKWAKEISEIELPTNSLKRRRKVAMMSQSQMKKNSKLLRDKTESKRSSKKSRRH